MRKSKINRKTSETDISVEINLDGKVPFLEFGLNTDKKAKECFFLRIEKSDLYDNSIKNKVVGMLVDELPANLSITPEGKWVVSNPTIWSIISKPFFGLITGLFVSVFIVIFLK